MGYIDDLKRRLSTHAVYGHEDQKQENILHDRISSFSKASLHGRWRLLPTMPIVLFICALLLICVAIGIWRHHSSVLSDDLLKEQSSFTENSAANDEDISQKDDERVSQSSDEPQSDGKIFPLGYAHEAASRNANGKQDITVYVSGNVIHPGVVTLGGHARVYEAIDSVGGLDSEADPSSVNLARELVDGEHIIVRPKGYTGADNGLKENESGTKETSPCVDLNSADARQLEELDGVGPALARRIVSYRQKNGAFSALADVDAVPGIGAAMLEKIATKTCQR
ncbi:helix-hairpin-helix domain-containing protein [Schaalia sp. lx-260]|uniref:helix-hairpin-helix domain-containing protein n=1 Tax=Schaalia sp. lx-260 TaxID=2899082 RepID=UPI001E460DDF|nr:ComEA family DNA-binding protein [Schaalia sp. lx-260]MCD4549613.1 ComEA family DNA-binding protein [Schaalia sp. lx-260]